MMTIVEGPDCAGKTTLIKNAWQNAAWKRHFGPPSNKGAWVQYRDQLAEDQRVIDQGWENDEDQRDYATALDPVRHMVYDRFIYGELVYPQVIPRSTLFTAAHARMLARVVLSFRGVLVYCQPSRELCLDLWRERQETELLKKEEKFLLAYDLWEKLYSTGKFHLPTVRYDLEQDSYKSICQRVNTKRPNVNKGPGIGMYEAGVVLMVGEQVNQIVDTWGWPFVADGGSSVWLAQQLEAWNVPETELYWINALSREGFETPADFVKELLPRQIIALGKTAELWCKRNQVDKVAPVAPMPHPQFWKRFHSRELYPLQDLLTRETK